MIRLSSQKEPFVTEEGLITPKNKNLFWAFGLVAGSWLICLFISGVVLLVDWMERSKEIGETPAAFSQFLSESEFRSYLNQARDYSGMSMFGMGRNEVANMMPAELSFSADSGKAERYSETNVQVAGIDEPDIVKTDGEHIYVSSDEMPYFIEPVPMVLEELMPPDMPVQKPRYVQPSTDIIQAHPISDIKQMGSIEINGELLLTKNRLLVFENRKLSGFDISDVSKPRKKWEYELDGNRQIETARLIGDTVILVTKTSVYQNSPCPIPLWKGNEGEITIPCTEIWKPNMIAPIDGIYTVVNLDPTDGSVLQKISFAGSVHQTVVYISFDAAYVTFTHSKSYEELLAAVLLDPETRLIDEETKKKLENIFDLDISRAAKQVEIEQILAGYTSTMSDDSRMKWQAEITNAMDAYTKAHKREIEETVISKVDIATMQISATGKVPGRLLNQFSLDEYENDLRVATTISGQVTNFGQSVNDVYILDEKLKMAGSVTDLGIDERIYAVRFIGERGFVVTFRETDPLYVLDLSDSSAPKVVGELKIPGYSSYLHPLTTDLIVGIGKEENRVKVSLFDVANPENPMEVDTYILPDYWSDILSTHLAFLQDPKHQVFFVPASSGGYIFGYEGNNLELLKTVAEGSIKRSLYIDDYLYLIGNRNIIVISESDWTSARTFEW